MVKGLIIYLLFAGFFGLEIYPAIATSIYWNPIYVTQTTVIEFPLGELGYIVIQAIPINIWIDKNGEERILPFNERLPSECFGSIGFDAEVFGGWSVEE